MPKFAKNGTNGVMRMKKKNEKIPIFKAKNLHIYIELLQLIGYRRITSM